MLDGSRRRAWVASACTDGRHEIHISSAEAVTTWRTQTDSVAAWVEEGVDTDTEVWTSAQTHYEAYAAWAKSTGHMPVSATKFGVRMKEYTDVRRGRSGMLHRVHIRGGVDEGVVSALLD
jgi:hypothetical protein